MEKKARIYVLVALGVLVVAFIVLAVWVRLRPVTADQNPEPARNINVETLAGDNEERLGTLIYSGARLEGEVRQDDAGSQVADLVTPDTAQGAFNIYYQDLVNRYKAYKVDKKDVTKDDAYGGKAKEITVTGAEGTLDVLIWPRADGMAQIQIRTSSNFK